jgi:hypothetical protein
LALAQGLGLLVSGLIVGINAACVIARAWVLARL